nr:GntR family transcriptional regulator [uncultured Caproiciproducens sp.]
MENSTSNLKATAYAYIKEKILNCEYYPGQNISEKQIVETICAGRTPVREALITLQKENLVEVYPRKGTCAKTIITSDVMELYQLRKLIEPTVAVKFKRNINYAKLLEFDSKFKENSDHSGSESDKQFYSLDVEFHQFIVNSTENSRLIRMFRELMQDTYRIGIFSALLHNNNSKAATYSQHNRIVQSILMEDDAEIEAAFTSHINNSLVSALETLRKAPLTP